MIFMRFLLVLAVSTAGAGFLVVAYLHWVDEYIGRHPGGYVIARLSVASIRRRYYIGGVSVAWLLSNMVWRVTTWAVTEEPPSYVWHLPTIVLIAVAIICARRIVQQRSSGPTSQDLW